MLRDQGDDITVSTDSSGVVVALNRASAAAVLSPEGQGFESQLSSQMDADVCVLIEKDLPCRHESSGTP